MAEAPFFSSQGTVDNEHQIHLDQENITSSPLTAPWATGSRKLRKPPPITPKRFEKFFTPRHTTSARVPQSKAGRQLRDITRNAVNRRRAVERDVLAKYELQDESADSLLCSRPAKRRKQLNALDSPPPQSSPLKYIRLYKPTHVYAASLDVTDDDAALSELGEDLEPCPTRVQRFREQDAGIRLLQRSFGGYDTLHRGRRGQDHCGDWRAETANFHSAPDDIYSFAGTALPFCTSSCNTNSLVAVGDEEGSVCLLDTAVANDLSEAADFTKAHVTFRPHRNAIMDIAFSSDDYVLATASGDQTARIIDMRTQQTRTILSGHTSSVKQVRFQPDDDQILATSSRDGSVQIWDLRCKGKDAVHEYRHSATIRVTQQEQVLYSKTTLPVGTGYTTTASCSVTAISFLTQRQHMLLTANEASASLKLWDLRHSSSRRIPFMPVSSISEPESHSKTRRFGVNSMVLSGDGGRLYSVCRDSTVYAYSTNQLLLGSTGRSGGVKETKVGVGPLYAFRHDAFRTGTFYVKAALRPANADRTEMLALGSSDGTAVVFPTDERHLPCLRTRSHEVVDADEDQECPTLRPTQRRTASTSALKDSLPIYTSGTALVRGHRKEVTSLTWTYDGDLVTLGDDFMARCWREDAGKARDLRLCGESAGKRWGCGWADVGEAWDEED